jgi:excisionase family DNA binding protein
MNEFKDFFSTAEAAKILRISRVAVFKRITSGEMIAVKVGRNYIISKEEIAKALGLVLGEKSKEKIDKTVRKAMKQYGETFRKLGKE